MRFKVRLKLYYDAPSLIIETKDQQVKFDFDLYSPWGKDQPTKKWWFSLNNTPIEVRSAVSDSADKLKNALDAACPKGVGADKSLAHLVKEYEAEGIKDVIETLTIEVSKIHADLKVSHVKLAQFGSSIANTPELSQKDKSKQLDQGPRGLSS